METDDPLWSIRKDSYFIYTYTGKFVKKCPLLRNVCSTGREHYAKNVKVQLRVIVLVTNPYSVVSAEFIHFINVYYFPEMLSV